MIINTDASAPYIANSLFSRKAETNARQINEVQSGNSTVEKTDDMTTAFTLSSFQRELTPDEQRRVEFLKNLLVQTLTMAQGDPTEDQKRQIRDVEEELEKLTGVKTRTKISTITDRVPGKKEKNEDEEKHERQAKGIDPKEAVHNNVEIKPQVMNPGMQMLRNNAMFGSIQALDLGSLKPPQI